MHNHCTDLDPLDCFDRPESDSFAKLIREAIFNIENQPMERPMYFAPAHADIERICRELESAPPIVLPSHIEIRFEFNVPFIPTEGEDAFQTKLAMLEGHDEFSDKLDCLEYTNDDFTYGLETMGEYGDVSDFENRLNALDCDDEDFDVRQ